MPSYADTAQSVLIEYMMIKGFLAFIGILLIGYGISWIIDKIRGKDDKQDTTNDA